MKNRWLMLMITAASCFFCFASKGSQKKLAKKETKDDVYPAMVLLRKKSLSAPSLSTIQEEKINELSDDERVKKKNLEKILGPEYGIMKIMAESMAIVVLTRAIDEYDKETEKNT